MEIEFHSVDELKKRLMPALKIRKRELAKNNIHLEIDKIWNYFVRIYFKKAHQLSLSEMVNVILNSDIDINLIQGDDKGMIL